LCIAIPGKAKIAETLENSMSLHVTARSLHVVARLHQVTFLSLLQTVNLIFYQKNTFNLGKAINSDKIFNIVENFLLDLYHIPVQIEI
jgi:hypothetical protein